MKKGNKGIVAVGVALGAIAGAIGGVLLAPKSGKETRADIAKYLNEIKEKVTEELSKAGEITKEKYQTTVAKVIESYEKGKKLSADDAKKIKDDFDKKYEDVKKSALKDKK